MFTKYILLLLVLVGSQATYAAPHEAVDASPRWLTDIAKNLIEKLVNLITGMVETQLDKLRNIKDKITHITDAAIERAKAAINSLIDETIGKIRKIAQDAIDAGIDIAECYVTNVDNLNQLRRQLIVDEVLCVANEMTAFTDIIDGAINNFTSDLVIVASFPKRLQGCVLNISAITCITEIINEVSALQKDIPQQILGTMLDIADYFTGFGPTVHACQFDVLRTAVEESRAVVDHMTKCIRDPEHNHGSIILDHD